MTRGLLHLAALLAVALSATAAVGGGEPSTAARDDPIGRTWVHDCPGGRSFVVEVSGDRVRLFTDAGPVRLARAVSASGARFTDGRHLYWSKGRNARIATPAGAWAACAGREIVDPREAARLRGVDVRAIGQEPGWIVELRQEDRLVAVLDYGARSLSAPAPPPQVEDGATVWRTTSGSRSVTLRLDDTPCRDAMSGRPFPATARLTIDGEAWIGCARRLE